MRANRWLVLLGVAIPTLMIEMAGTGVFVALEVITTDLGVSIHRSAWLTTMYLAANALMLPLAGWLGKKLGYRNVIIAGILVFTASALLGGLSRSFDTLVLFRTLQGLGDGPMIPVITALLLELFPVRERGRMMAGLMLAIGLAPALGPLLSSWVVETLGWRGIFHANVILGLVSLAAVSCLLPPMRARGDGVAVSWRAFVPLALFTGSFQLFLDRGQHYDWFASGWMVALFTLAVLALAAFGVVIWVTRDRSILDLTLLRDLSFLTGNLANVLLLGAVYGALMLKVLYLQWLMGYTARQVGSYQAVLAGSMLLSGLLAGAITDRVHPRWPVLAGWPILMYGLWLASRLTLFAGGETIWRVGVMVGAGVGLVAVPLSVTVFATIPHHRLGAATVVNSYLSAMGGGIALAAAAALFMHRLDVSLVHLGAAARLGQPAYRRYLMPGAFSLEALYQRVLAEAAVVAFNEVMYAAALLLCLLVVYLPFIKKATPSGPAGTS